MSHSKNQIIAAFSNFYLYQSGQKISHEDRDAQRQIVALVNINELGTVDDWARYFLLIFRHRPIQLFEQWIMRSLSSNPHGQSAIQSIHQQLLSNQGHNPKVAEFIGNPTAIAERLLFVHVLRQCWYAAQSCHEKFSPHEKNKYPLEDCIQIAQSICVNSGTKFLKNFDVDQNSSTIKTYAEKKLLGRLRDEIYKKKLIGKYFSDWAILRYASKKEMMNSLLSINKSSANGLCPKVEAYQLVYNCFREIYTTRQERQKQLPEPTGEQIDQIYALYQKRQQALNINFAIARLEILDILKQCAKEVRNYRNILGESTISIDTVGIDNTEKFTEELSSDSDAIKPDDQLPEIAHIIANSLHDLNEKELEVLELYLGLKCTQIDILRWFGPTLKMHEQYQISRYVRKIKKDLAERVILKFYEIHSENFERELISNKLPQAFDLIEDCLEKYFRESLRKDLKQFLANPTIRSNITNLLLIEQEKHPVCRSRQWLKSRFQIDFNTCDSIDRKLDRLIESEKN